MTNAEKLVSLGVPAEVAKVISDMVAAAAADPSSTDIEVAIATKTEVAALTSGSSAADIVAALQA